MKYDRTKIMVGIFLTLSAMAQAQTVLPDTVYSRDNHFHYTEWYDSTTAFLTGNCQFEMKTWRGTPDSPWGMWHYTNHPIPVKGLACALIQPLNTVYPPSHPDPDFYIPDTRPEYLYLYEYSPTTHTIVLLDSVRWDTVAPRTMLFPAVADTEIYFSTLLYEVAFKSPVWVDSDFIVAASYYNERTFPYYEDDQSDFRWHTFHGQYAYIGSPIGNFEETCRYQVQAVRGLVCYNTFRDVWESPGWVGIDAYYGAFFAVVDYLELKAESADTARGYVTGGGMCYMGEERTLTAVGKDGCHFVRWNDGSIENPRTVTVTCDTAFTAYFDTVPWYKVYAVSNNEEWGTVEISDGAYIYQGGQVTLTAVRGCGLCEFSHWEDSTTANPRTVTIYGDTLFTAYFTKYFGVECPDNNIAFSLRPNPTRDRLTVERPTAGPATLEVFNAKGQKVMTMASDQATVTLDVSSLAAGSYLLRVTTSEGSSVRNFVVGK